MNKHIVLVGLNYKTAPVEIRERFALTDPKILENGVVPIDSTIAECMILSTCNRVEIIAVSEHLDAHTHLLNCWAKVCKQPLDILQTHTYTYIGNEAVHHLFRVASSLDSMVLGEPQILGQLKDTYRTALKNRHVKVILNKLLHKSFSVAKRVRSETAVASSAVSISYAAVELAKRIFDDMHNIKAMLIGAGEMAELAATHLISAGIQSVRVANRTHERALQLAKQYGGAAVPFEALIEHLSEVDIIISSTGAHEPIIRAKDMKNILKSRKNKPMFFIDIAVPRDIDPDVNHLDNVYLYDIDDLKEVVEENLAGRQEEACKAMTIVDTETEVFAKWLEQLDLQPTIVELIQRGERIAQEELEKTLKRIGPVDDEAKEALEIMLTAIIKKINHEPIVFLKRRFEEEDMAELALHTVRRIFNLDDENVPADAHLGRKLKKISNAKKPIAFPSGAMSSESIVTSTTPASVISSSVIPTATISTDSVQIQENTPAKKEILTPQLVLKNTKTGCN